MQNRTAKGIVNYIKKKTNKKTQVYIMEEQEEIRNKNHFS